MIFAPKLLQCKNNLFFDIVKLQRATNKPSTIMKYKSIVNRYNIETVTYKGEYSPTLDVVVIDVGDDWL